MTREEAKEILRHWDDVEWREENLVSMGEMSDAICLAEKALGEPTQEQFIDMDAALAWHKVSEELPYRNGIYLIRGIYENLTKDIFYSTSAYDVEYGRFINYPSYGIITHWMYIPEIKEG